MQCELLDVQQSTPCQIGGGNDPCSIAMAQECMVKSSCYVRQPLYPPFLRAQWLDPGERVGEYRFRHLVEYLLLLPEVPIQRGILHPQTLGKTSHGHSF